MFVEGSERVVPHPQCYEYQSGLREGNYDECCFELKCFFLCLFLRARGGLCNQLPLNLGHHGVN